RKDSAPSGAGAFDSDGVPANDDDGRKTTGTVSADDGQTKVSARSVAPDPRLVEYQAKLAKPKTKLTELKAAPESQFKDPRDRGFEISRLKSSIYILEGEVAILTRRANLREELRGLAAYFDSGDGANKARAPNGIAKLKRAISIAKEVGESVEPLCELLADADPRSAPFESERALYAIVRNLPRIENPGALAASLIKAHSDNVRKARIALNEAIERQPRSLNSYLWGIVNKEEQVL